MQREQLRGYLLLRILGDHFPHELDQRLGDLFVLFLSQFEGLFALFLWQLSLLVFLLLFLCQFSCKFLLKDPVDLVIQSLFYLYGVVLGVNLDNRVV